MLPRESGLQIIEQSREHFAILNAVLNSPEIERVVCATDASGCSIHSSAWEPCRSRKTSSRKIVLKDDTLRAIASRKPKSLADLMQVKGAGPRLLQKHGVAILQVVRR